MRLLGIFSRLVREQLREPWMALLTLAFGPLLVLVYFFITGGGSTSYTLGVLNNDGGALGTELVRKLSEGTYADGSPLLHLTKVSGQAEAEAALRSRKLDAFLVVSADFSTALEARWPGTAGSPGADRVGGAGAVPADPPPSARLTLVRDFSNVRSTIHLFMAATALEDIQKDLRGAPPPVAFEDLALGNSGTRTEFEGYVPGLLIFSVVMLIFQGAMLASREVEKLTLRRLAMSPMTTVDFLGGITLFELLMGMASTGVTLATAMVCGFGIAGSLPLVLGTIALTALSVIGLSLVVSAFARSALEAFIIANIPLAFLMFFSGAMFPLPRMELANLGPVSVGLFDFLPPTHGVNALNKLFSGEGLASIGYECVTLVVLTAGYFALGVVLYRARRMKTID